MEQSASIKIVYGRQSHCILKNLDASSSQFMIYNIISLAKNLFSCQIFLSLKTKVIKHNKLQL